MPESKKDTPVDVSANTLLKQATLKIRSLHKQLQESESQSSDKASNNYANEAIAIVGMGCRFPGAVQNPEDYWQLLTSGTDAITRVPNDRWDAEHFYNPDYNAKGHIVTKHGGFLDDVKGFDPQFFGISPREAKAIDPQQRLLLEVTHEALENAGLATDKLRGTATGVFVGLCFDDYAQRSVRSGDPTLIDVQNALGTNRSIAAGRIAYVYGFQGPVLQLDTTCSSSLVCLHLACRSLKSGEANVALAGGVNLMLSPEASIGFSRLNALSTDGRCRTFDAKAQGYSRGEGCGMLVLKRLSDAQKNGDKVLAVVAASAVNHDGASNGLTAPNGLSQTAVIRSALNQANLNVDDIQYVETHGTATPLGDPIELTALADAYGERKQALLVGSVKTNFGHLESAAGVAGLIKSVLAVQHSQIPPHLHFNKPSAQIPWQKLPIKVVTQNTSWPITQGLRRAGVSSFGMSGTNAHVIIEQAPTPVERSPSDHISPSDNSISQLLPLSAKSEPALRALLKTYQTLLQNSDLSLMDVCLSAQNNRTHYAKRIAFTASNKAQMLQCIEGALSETTLKNKIPGTSHKALLELAKSYELGVNLNWAELKQGQSYNQVTLPTYPFQRKDYWLSTTKASALVAPPPTSAQWPGTKLPIAGHNIHIFETYLNDTNKVCWQDHKVMDLALFPTAGYLSLLLSFGQQLGLGAFRIKCLELHQGLWIAQEQKLQTQWRRKGENTWAFDCVIDSQLYVSGEVELQTTLMPYKSSFTQDRAIEENQFSTKEFYDLYLKVGIEYGASFRLLTQIKSNKKWAYAHIYDNSSVSKFDGVQPELLDAGLQLCGVFLSEQKQCWLPASISHFEWHGEQIGIDCIIAENISSDEDIGMFNVSWMGDAGQIIGHLSGLKLKKVSVLESSSNEGLNATDHALLAPKCFSIDWLDSSLPQPSALLDASNVYQKSLAHLNILPSNTGVVAYQQLQPLLEVLSLVYAESALIDLKVHLDTLSHNSLIQLGIIPEYIPLVQCLAHNLQQSKVDLKASDTSFLMKKSSVLCRQILQKFPEAKSEVELLTRCGEALPNVLQGHRQATDVLFPSGDLNLLTKLYQESPGAQVINGLLSQTLSLLISDWPQQRTLRVLEVGAGTGGSSAHLLPLLEQLKTTNVGIEVEYYFTDVSEHFLDHAKTRFKKYTFVKYQLLDIEKTPDQNLINHFDLVVAANVLHATKNLQQTLNNVNNLLTDKGQLLLLEATTALNWLDLVFGLMPGWWRFDNKEQVNNKSLRPNHPLLGIEQWQTVLTGMGFTTVKPMQCNPPLAQSIMLAQRDARRDRVKQWVLLSLEDSYSGSIASEIHKQGDKLITPNCLSDVTAHQKSECSGLIFVLPTIFEHQAQPDLIAQGNDSDNFIRIVNNLSQTILTVFKELSQWQSSPRLWLVGGGDKNPLAQLVYASLWGWVQTAQWEYPSLQCSLINADAANVVNEINAQRNEIQIRISNGQRQVARLQNKKKAYQLKIDASYVLSDLHWTNSRIPELDENQILIQVRATGINFRDVLIAMDQYPEPGSLGAECSGDIVAIGSNVEKFNIGDRVMAIVENGFSSHVAVDQALAHIIPRGVSFSQAATLSVAFVTAAHSLLSLAKLKKGERVLIHNATGGVGMAALQIATEKGANIFASASKNKQGDLRQMGITQVFDSRNPDFAEAILNVTCGAGVDVVLNALPGELQLASLKSLSSTGRFIDIGKGVGLSATDFSLRAPKVQFHRLDLVTLCKESPSNVRSELKRVYEKITADCWQPLPFTSYRRSQVGDAFRRLQQANHLGKLVLSHEEKDDLFSDRLDEFNENLDDKPIIIQAEKTYLVTGGLGALGLLTAQWLAEQGARHLCLIGRKATVDDPKLSDLKKQGVLVNVQNVDVSNHKAMQQVIEGIQKSPQPLAGVIHGAGVLDDQLIESMSAKQLQKVLMPKVNGGWILHQLTRTLNLDCFVLFSSASGVLGAPGQANYSTANAFLNGLAHYRQSLGLPALSLAWGAWSQVGAALKYQQNGKISGLAGVGVINPQQGMQLMSQLWNSKQSCITMLPIDWSQFLSHPRAGGQALFERLQLTAGVRYPNKSAPTKDHADQYEKLMRLAPEQRNQYLKEYLYDTIADTLGMTASELDPQLGFFDLGLDSLTALELKNRLQAELSVILPATLVFDYPTSETLLLYLQTQFNTNPKAENKNRAEAVIVNASTITPIVSEGPATDSIAQQLDSTLDSLDDLFGESDD